MEDWHAGRFREDGLAYRLCAVLSWQLSGLTPIREMGGTIVPLRPNRIQQIEWLTAMGQAMAGKPVRLKIGKARRGGTSTYWQCALSVMCLLWPNQQSFTITHRDDTTDVLNRIGRRAVERYTGTDGLIASAHRYENGSLNRFATAGGVAVGAGDTLNLLHRSEIAKWKANKEETLGDTSEALADVPNSICIDESSFKGRDLFWSQFEAARNGETGFAAIFIPWFLDDRCIVPVERFERTPEERDLIALARDDYGVELTDDNLQWRRQRIAVLGEDRFRQERPATPEEAVQSASGLLFPNARRWIIEDDHLPFEYGHLPVTERIGGIDFGYADPTVIWSGVYRDQTLYLLSYWRAVESLAADRVEGLMQGHTYYCDPADLTARKELQQTAERAGVSVRLYPAPRRNITHENTEQTELHNMIAFCAAGRVKVRRSCAQQLIAEADDLAWNTTTGKADMKRSENVGHYDSIMALKYLIMGVAASGVGQERKPEHRPATRRSQFSAC